MCCTRVYLLFRARRKQACFCELGLVCRLKSEPEGLVSKRGDEETACLSRPCACEWVRWRVLLMAVAQTPLARQQISLEASAKCRARKRCVLISSNRLLCVCRVVFVPELASMHSCRPSWLPGRRNIHRSFGPRSRNLPRHIFWPVWRNVLW